MRGAFSVLARPFTQTTGLARWMLVVGVILTGVFVVCALFAPWLAPYGFAQASANGVEFPKLGHPSSQHLFGTDRLFFDVLSRVIWGARTALEVVILSIFLCVVIGVPLGLASGYYGGWFDRIVVLIMDAMYAFPSFLLAIVFSFLLTDVFGGSVVAVSLSLTAVYIPQYFRVIRNSVISVREEPYVEAARVLGARPRTVISKYVFGNVVQNVPVIATLNAADALLTLAGLGFLGYGVQPTQAAEWGYDLQRALTEVSTGVWWTSVYPGLAIVLLVTGLTLVGESLNDLINPVLRRRPTQKVVFEPIEPAPDEAAT